jgi:putative PIN family toxin of toxin-antitoxin system
MSFAERIVIDTGTLISAALRAGSIPSQAYEKALRGYEICVSASALAELERVMRRDKFDAYLELQERIAFVELYRSRAVMLEVREEVRDCRDPKDNQFLELALSAGAAIILSSDPDLCLMHPYRGIAILKPADFLLLRPAMGA